MDFSWTDKERSFRAEVRSWLAANVPKQPLPSGDTRAGFALHVGWEKRLFDEPAAIDSSLRRARAGETLGCSTIAPLSTITIQIE